MVIANDNTVASGSWWPRTPEKIERAQEMALRLRTPVDLPRGLFRACSYRSNRDPSRAGPGPGHIFKKNSELSAAGVSPDRRRVRRLHCRWRLHADHLRSGVHDRPGVHGHCRRCAHQGREVACSLSSLDIGGPDVHVHQSGCADVRVPDDATVAIRDDSRGDRAHCRPPARSSIDTASPPRTPHFTRRSELSSDLLPADRSHELRGRRGPGAPRRPQLVLGRSLPDRGQGDDRRGSGESNGLYVGFVDRTGKASSTTRRTAQPEEGRRASSIARASPKVAAFSRACDADGIPDLLAAGHLRASTSASRRSGLGLLGLRLEL